MPSAAAQGRPEAETYPDPGSWPLKGGTFLTSALTSLDSITPIFQFSHHSFLDSYIDQQDLSRWGTVELFSLNFQKVVYLFQSASEASPQVVG